jgi:AraC-like DNA-binding protein
MEYNEQLAFLIGRKNFNHRRRRAAWWRMIKIAQAMGTTIPLPHGFQAKLARQLGCHRGTVCRAVKRIEIEARERALYSRWVRESFPD